METRMGIANPSESLLTDRLSGMLLGAAVGDALGLPAEGLSRRRTRRWFAGPLRHRFFCGHGMVSDDTEHLFMVAQSLLAEPEDADAFAHALAVRLRGWFLRLPPGIGMATAKACLRLCCGFSPESSGVFSAGNGPAMRAALFGVLADAPKRAAFVRASTRLTHTDFRAQTGALAVAQIAALALRASPAQQTPRPEEVLRALGEIAVAPEDKEWPALLGILREAWQARLSVSDFADRLGLGKGVGGYIYHTVPVAIYAWLHHFGDVRATLSAVIACGGDTDTVGAIAGALAGASTGAAGIPAEWTDGIWDAPIHLSLLRQVAQRLGQTFGAEKPQHPPGPAPWFWPLGLPRNLFFLAIVLLHGFRRLLPPY
jgi:ADP-ribosylglycohydrolase